MRIAADLHIHSRFSRATSPLLTPASLDRWARIKGLDLVGTGDCTHPQWLRELRSQLEDSQEGLYVLSRAARKTFDAGPALTLNLPCPAGQNGAEPRFVLTGEISTIYSRDGKTRKVHHVVVLPDFRAAEVFAGRLSRVGNIVSDGRPILGVDSRDLLAMLLDADSRSLLVPAHIWTPWFSALGAKSGFDSLDECYRDLAPHVHALETGLSSNPPMNWAVDSLSRFKIISNSDAHSPDKLGREATIFSMEMTYSSLAAALGAGVCTGPAGGASTDSSGAAFSPDILETIEFFPQEGKYHYDGHRLCGAALDPEESLRLSGLCPVCGKPLTQGVMRRVMELASRPVDEEAPCPEDFGGTNARPYRSLIPLKELAAELLETGAASKKTAEAYRFLVEKAGSEFALLLDMKIEDIGRLRCPGLSGELLAEAVRRMREGKVSLKPGYDGEYGIVHVFSEGEEKTGYGGGGLFGDKEKIQPRAKTAKTHSGKRAAPHAHKDAGQSSAGQEAAPARKPEDAEAQAVTLSVEQEKAVRHRGGHSIIIAGPGAGKTAVLALRIARLIENGEPAAAVLALTFTVKAASQLRERIAKTLGAEKEPLAREITAATFHSFCASVLREQASAAGLPPDFEVASEEVQEEILKTALKEAKLPDGASRPRFQTASRYIEERKRFLLLPTVPEAPAAPAAPAELPPELAALAQEFGLPPPEPVLENVYREYRSRLREKRLLDFDDLVAGAARLLARKSGILLHYQKRFRHIFVDEYQDINFAQYALLRLLAPAATTTATENSSGEPAGLCVIGDPNQAIYGFRGADTRYIDRFSRDYPGAALYNLSQSFRCAAPILTAAGRLVGAHLEGPGHGVSLYRSAHPTEKAEAEGIARRISRLIGGTTFFAIDSRVSQPQGEIEEIEGTQAAPLTSLGDCAILLRAAALSPPIEKALQDHGIPFHLIGEKPWREEARIYVDAVSILTMHAAKGLEFSHVFIAGLEDGILPFTLYDENPTSAVRSNEEKRLLYVAMTRAKTGLYLSWAATRIFRGRKLTANPSPFLADIENLIPKAACELPRREKDPQLTLF